MFKSNSNQKHPHSYKTKNVLLFLSTFITSYWSIAQERAISSFNVEDGLPCLEIYECHQSLDGHLWIASDMGVSRYNGREFKNFTTSDGLLNNSVLSIYEDQQGNIWFPSISKGLCYWNGKRITPYKYNDSLLKYIPDAHTDRIHMDHNQNLWIVPYNKTGLLKITKHGQCKWEFDTITTNFHFIKVFNNHHSLSGFHKPRKTSTINELLIFDDSGKKISIPNFTTPQNFLGESYLSDSTLLFSSENHLYQIHKDSIESFASFNGRIYSIYIDSKRNIWVTTEEGLHVFKGGVLNRHDLVLSQTGLCHIIEDEEGSFWISSLNDGLIHMPELPWFKINSPPNFPESIYSIDNQEHTMVLNSFGGSVALIPNLNEPEIEVLSNISKSYRSDVKILNNNIYTSEDIIDPFLKKVTPANYRSKGRVLRFSSPNDSCLIIAQTNGISPQHCPFSYFEKINERIEIALFREEDNTILIGKREGLFLLNYSSQHKTDSTLLEGHITDILEHGKLTWILTHGDGVILIKDTLITKINETLNLTSNICTRGLCDNDGNLWVGTNKGLNKIAVKSLSPLKLKIERYDVGNGLPSNQINDIGIFNDNLYLATNKGLITISLNSLVLSPKKTKFYLKNLFHNQKEMEIKESVTIPPGKHNVTFEIQGISLNQSDKLYFRYKLVGQDKKWTLTNKPEIRYTNLPPGHYTLLAQASINNTDWSPVKKLTTLKIEAHIYETLFFKIVITIVSCFLTLALVWLVISFF